MIAVRQISDSRRLYWLLLFVAYVGNVNDRLVYISGLLFRVCLSLMIRFWFNVISDWLLSLLFRLFVV